MSYTLGLALRFLRRQIVSNCLPSNRLVGVFLTGLSHIVLCLVWQATTVTATQTGISPVLTTSANLFGGVAGKADLAPIDCYRSRQPVWLAGKPISFAIQSSIRSHYWFCSRDRAPTGWVVPGAIPVDPGTGMKHSRSIIDRVASGCRFDPHSNTQLRWTR